MPQDLVGRHIPERYLAGLPPEIQRQRVKELTESRDAYWRGDYSELPSDVAARKLGLVKQSAYTKVAKDRGIEWRGDAQDMAHRVLAYYGAKASPQQVSKFANALDQVFRKGLAAWKSGGHRPGATAQNWAVARVNSLVVGGKAAWTADRKQFAVLPPAVQRAIVRHMGYVIQALADQGRESDVQFLMSQIKSSQAVLNPLMGWEHVGEPFAPEEIDRASRPLFSPNAPRVYAEKLKSTILPIYVLIGRPTSEAWEVANREAARGNTVLWLQETLSSFLLRIGISADEVNERMANKAGEIDRVSPMTPFTLLHRMGDTIGVIRKKDVLDICRMLERWRYWENPISDEGMKADDQMFSTGVNTLAGRKGYFTSPREALSDLWAKYLLTGRIDYDPEAGGPWPDSGFSSPSYGLLARRDYFKKMHQYFPMWLEWSRGKVIPLTEE